MKNLKLTKKDANNYYKRNFKYYEDIYKEKNTHFKNYFNKVSNLLKLNNVKPKSILMLGCGDGNKLYYHKKILKSQINCGIDISSSAIQSGKKRYKDIQLFNMTSLELIEKYKYDFVICNHFLYQLDREEIFSQFNKIYKKINIGGYLLIEDFDPLFKHTNINIHNKKIKSYKMSYDNFLEESGLFKLVSKIRISQKSTWARKDKKNFKSDDLGLSLFKKINFDKSFPENI